MAARCKLLVTSFRTRRRFCFFSLHPGLAHASGRGGGDVALEYSGFSGARVLVTVLDHACLPISARLIIVTD